MTVSEIRDGTATLREMIGLHEEPLAFFYTDAEPEGYRPSGKGWGCVVAVMARARRGETVYFDGEHVGCAGGGYYLGFCPMRPEIAEYVSTGIPGKLEGEHYKKSPDLVRAALDAFPAPKAPAKYAVVKPVSALTDGETPDVVICFATPGELSGLVFLAHYEREEDGVVCPFNSGCGAIVSRPLLEAERDQPRAVLGMFDPSARPFAPENTLSFAAPRAMWEEMLSNAAESFLTTETWAKARKKAERAGEA